MFHFQNVFLVQDDQLSLYDCPEPCDMLHSRNIHPVHSTNRTFRCLLALTCANPYLRDHPVSLQTSNRFIRTRRSHYVQCCRHPSISDPPPQRRCEPSVWSNHVVQERCGAFKRSSSTSLLLR
jgi:hypothetical protein